MKKFIFIILLILLHSKIFSQVINNEVYMTPFWDFYARNNLSAASNGKGGTGIASLNDLSGASINPASFNLENKITINAGFLYKTNVQWLSSIVDYVYLKPVIPTLMLGYSYKFSKDITAGILYQNDNSYKLDLGEMITTNEFGVETGRYEAYINVNKHTLTLPLALKINNFNLGLNFNASYLRGYFKSYHDTAHLVSNNFIFLPQAGIQIQMSRTLRTGFVVTPGYKKEVKWENSNGRIQKGDVYYPWKISAGLNYELGPNSFAVEYHFEGTSAEDNLKDKHNVKIGYENNLNKNWALRTGFATMFDYRIEKENVIWSEKPGEYDEYFITAGVGYKNEDYKWDFSVMNSSAGSKMIEQTIINLNFQYNLK